MRRGGRTKVAAVAARQENVISWEQLREAGVGRGLIERRLKAGTMQRCHRGVYLLGAAPPTEIGRCWAALLACAPGAAISHRSAAALWGMLAAPEDYVEVTVVGRNPPSQSGVKIHRSRTLQKQDLRRRNNSLPLTSPARTICDLATTEPLGLVERTLNEAQVLGLTSEREVRAALKRAGYRRGCSALARLLDDGPRITRNDMERLLLQLLEQAQLPRPVTNAPLLGYNVDCLWPSERLVVEFDGYAAHGHRRAFERDRRRDRALIAAGYRVIRVTWRALIDEPLAVIADIAQALKPAA